MFTKSKLNEKQATKIITTMLSELHPIHSDMGYDSFTDFVLPPDITINKDEEVKYIVDHGKANKLQLYYDQHNALFGSLPTIGFVSDIPGTSVSLQTNYLGKSQKIDSNGFIEKAEDSLSNDIIHFKNEFLSSINTENYDSCFRSYRSYLLSCISLCRIIPK